MTLIRLLPPLSLRELYRKLPPGKINWMRNLLDNELPNLVARARATRLLLTVRPHREAAARVSTSQS